MSDSCCHPIAHVQGSEHSHDHYSAVPYWNVLIAFVLAGICMVSGMPGLLGMGSSITTQIISFASALLVVVIFGRKFLFAIFKIFRSSDMDTLIGIGIVASFALSFWQWSEGNRHHLYFDSAAFIVAFVLLGQWVESLILKRIQDELPKWVELLPTKVRRIGNSETEEVALESLVTGDRIQVVKGERLPIDGKLISSSASLDESLVTGESRPAVHQKGDVLLQGALNLDQTIELEVLKSAEHGFYRTLTQFVQKSLSEKSPAEKRADKFAKVFVPFVVLLSAATAFYWGNIRHDFSVMATTAVSVLVIACPCALGLATPLAVLVTVLRLGRKDILLKNTDAMEKAGDVTIVAFDKTGTLTEGRPSVSKIFGAENISQKDVLQYAASFEQDSDHPYARAVMQKSKDDGVRAFPIRSSHLAPGKGVKAEIQVSGKWLSGAIGTLIWMYENGIDTTEIPQALKWEAEGASESALWLLLDGKVIGLILLTDKVRTEAKEAVQELEDFGFELGLITGDSENIARRVAKDLNLKFYHYGVLPEEKSTIVRRLSEKKKKGMDFLFPKVCFVGDGINDGPALATAHMGVAMGGGTALAQMSADAILLKNDVRGVADLFKILKGGRSLVWQNLAIAFIYNLIALPIAAGILVDRLDFVIEPSFAAIAMCLSSICLLANSLRWKMRA